MRRSSRAAWGRLGAVLMPLIDLVMLLVLFFALAQGVIQQPLLELELPKAGEAKENERPGAEPVISARALGLHRFPRASLCAGPTPLEPMANLSRQRGADFHVKRDDCTGLTLGGSKTLTRGGRLRRVRQRRPTLRPQLRRTLLLRCGRAASWEVWTGRRIT